jgi:hypothetical protein
LDGRLAGQDAVGKRNLLPMPRIEPLYPSCLLIAKLLYRLIYGVFSENVIE